MGSMPNKITEKHILTKAEVIAVVGLSPKEARPSNMVARYLLDAGYQVVPVNPGQEEILGQRCYASLKEVPGKVDVVSIFRRSEHVYPVVEQAIDKGVLAIWMQLGVVNTEAAALAEEHGIYVTMNHCLKIDHQELLG